MRPPGPVFPAYRCMQHSRQLAALLLSYTKPIWTALVRLTRGPPLSVSVDFFFSPTTLFTCYNGVQKPWQAVREGITRRVAIAVVLAKESTSRSVFLFFFSFSFRSFLFFPLHLLFSIFFHLIYRSTVFSPLSSLQRPYGIVVHYHPSPPAPVTVIPTIHLPRQLFIVISLTHPNTKPQIITRNQKPNTKPRPYEPATLQPATRYRDPRPATCHPRPATHLRFLPHLPLAISYLRIVYSLRAERSIPDVARRQPPTRPAAFRTHMSLRITIHYTSYLRRIL